MHAGYSQEVLEVRFISFLVLILPIIPLNTTTVRAHTHATQEIASIRLHSVNSTHNLAFFGIFCTAADFYRTRARAWD